MNEEKDKIKDASSGENLLEVPEEGETDLPFRSLLLEKSSILNEDTILVNLGMIDNPQITLIVATLSLKEQKVMTEFLQKGKINFVWTYKDMPGLDIDLVVHHLEVDQKIKPIKQKLCKMHPKVALLVKEELQKMLEAKFIRPIDYPEWVSNIVPIGKAFGGIRIYSNL